MDTVSGVIINDSGSANVAGINISISDIIGEKLANQWIAQLPPDEMELILKAITGNFIVVEKDWDGNPVKHVKNIVYDRFGHKVDSPYWEKVQQRFGEKFSQLIDQEVEKKLQSEETKELAVKIADEIVEYAINGYKEDVMRILRERLVGNIINKEPTYNDVSLYTMINTIINDRLKY